MEISIIKKSEKVDQKNFNRVVFNSKIIDSRFVEKDSQNLLEIKSFKEDKINRRNFVLLSREIIFYAKNFGSRKLILNWKDIKKYAKGISSDEALKIFLINIEMANYEFTKYKTILEEKQKPVEKFIVVQENNFGRAGKILEEAKIISREVNACRDLANMPGGDMTPKLLADEIKKSLKGTTVRMKILEEEDMKKIGMGAILGVARGSVEKPKFIILEYNMDLKEKPIILIGKGITFDTGGLNLKSDEGIKDMNLDMSGGAAVAHAIVAAAKLGVRKKIVGLIPAVENMPSGQSYRPGDILRSLSGKTIEVINTDAEGRIILADALSYAEKYDPKLVIDVATLTGAACVALGERACAIFSKNEKLVQAVRKIGEESGDYMWPLPLWVEYESEIKGILGDVANLNTQGNLRCGGAITGAIFLYQFAKKFPNWMHIDIAPRMVSVFDEFLAKGAAGAPVRMLVNFLQSKYEL